MSSATGRPDQSQTVFQQLTYDPRSALLTSVDPALTCRVRRDLLGEEIDVRELWELRPIERMARRQEPDGRFHYPGGGVPHLRSAEDYDQLETYGVLLELICKYALTVRHPVVDRAIEFLLSRQTAEGDFRGIYGRQYTPNYSAAILALMVEAGVEDEGVDRCFNWLLSMRQDDGGWAIPARTGEEGSTLGRALSAPETLPPERSMPSSHLVTGIVLRAFAAHSRWSQHEAARRAGSLLASRFFRADTYPDRRAPSYWKKLVYPFRWTDILSSLDALSQIGFGVENGDVLRGVTWLTGQQQPSGLWRCGYPNTKGSAADQWVTFAACRALARLL